MPAHERRLSRWECEWVWFIYSQPIPFRKPASCDQGSGSKSKGNMSSRRDPTIQAEPAVLSVDGNASRTAESRYAYPRRGPGRWAGTQNRAMGGKLELRVRIATLP